MWRLVPSHITKFFFMAPRAASPTSYRISEETVFRGVVRFTTKLTAGTIVSSLVVPRGLLTAMLLFAVVCLVSRNSPETVVEVVFLVFLLLRRGWIY